jgi:hypothetical protein
LIYHAKTKPMTSDLGINAYERLSQLSSGDLVLTLRYKKRGDGVPVDKCNIFCIDGWKAFVLPETPEEPKRCTPYMGIMSIYGHRRYDHRISQPKHHFSGLSSDGPWFCLGSDFPCPLPRSDTGKHTTVTLMNHVNSHFV